MPVAAGNSTDQRGICELYNQNSELKEAKSLCRVAKLGIKISVALIWSGVVLIGGCFLGWLTVEPARA